MKNIFITRKILDAGVKMLTDKGYNVDISPENRPLKKSEIIHFLKQKEYDGVLTLLTDQIDASVMDAAPTVKIYANYAIGYNNIKIDEAKKRNIYITNTPGGGADRVSEHTWALILALTCRIVEGDAMMRKGKWKGWDPMNLHGIRLHGKTLGIIGTGKIGSEVAEKGKKAFGMNIAYYDITKNENLERELGATFYSSPEEVLKIADIISLHVPLLPTTKHLINTERLSMMKKSAYLVNTSRGPVVDENALVHALTNGIIRGAGLDVYEKEPKTAKGLRKLPNVVMTPHIASATEDARYDMAMLSTGNIIDCMEGRVPRNNVIK